MHKHIANALKTRSRAIRTSLNRYNIAATALVPPQQLLDWEQVVEYAFLSDFDLLWDTWQDICSRPWATPAARFAMDQCFKLHHAKEEIKQLNIEIWWFATYMRDEDAYLRLKESSIVLSNPPLANQIMIYRMKRGHFNVHHTDILRKIYVLKGFTSTWELGTCLEVAIPNIPEELPLPPPTTYDAPLPMIHGDMLGFDGEEELEDEQVGKDEDMLVLGAYYSVLDMSSDGPLRGKED
jgi:hypothetical protein